MSESRVVEKVKKRIGELELAIQRLDFVKRHLNQNSSEIKCQIHTSMSRHLETLRDREVLLLGQVDTVLGGKEDVLHRQQARLNKALGILQSSLAHATRCDDDTAAKHLVHALEELNASELKAEETPYIAFRADHVSLRESILSYGRVDANGMPLMSAFADEDEPSASLPRHVEEYGDSEDHVFYKALQDVKANSARICVTMPKLSSRVEDWLQRPVLQLSTSADEVQSPSSETAGTPVSQTTCSIDNWLSQIKHNPDVEEEDDFEIVDHSGSSRRESPVDEEVKPLPMAEQQEFHDLFHHISRDMRQWLLKGVNSRSGPLAEDLRAFFKHIPQDTSMWLVAARRQLESLDELKRGAWFGHIPTELSTWLRRAHDRRPPSSAAPPAQSAMFAHISHDKRDWLSKATPAGEETEAEEDGSFLKVGAAEGCASFPCAPPSCPPAPLSSIPDLMKDFVSVTPQATAFWLLAQEGGAADAAPSVSSLSALPGIQKYLSADLNTNAWLAGRAGETGEIRPPSGARGFFSHIPTNKSHWLSKQRACPGPSRSIDLKNVVKEDHREWLRSGSSALTEKSTALPASPLDSLRQSHSLMSTSDWLLGGERRDSDSTLSTKSWTVCSSESSVSSSSSSQQSMASTSGRQIPPVDLSAWIYQKYL